MEAVLAALPIGLVVAAMTLLRWSAAAAGAAGLLAAVLLAAGGLGAVYPALGPLPSLAGALLEALFVTATILWIIFPALCIYEIQARSGAFDTIRAALARVTDDPRLQALLVAWFFGLFMEGVAGFGTPVALAAPILVGLGFPPLHAVTLALIGHAAGVSFGAVGTPVLPQMAATGLSGLELARPIALLHALVGWTLVVGLFLMAAGGRPGLGSLRWPLLAGLLFYCPFLLLAWFVGPELPTLGGAIIGGGIFAWLIGRDRGTGSDEDAPPAGALVRAALPYLVLLALILVSRLVDPLQGLLRSVEISWSLFGVFSGRMEPLYHPGTMLLLGFLIGGLMQGRSAAELAGAMAAAAARLGLVGLALLAMLGLSRVLVHTGMIDMLAESAAASGPLWPLLAPFIGVLGTFVTGSATSSNILFSEFQEATAAALSLPDDLLQGLQNYGAAIGNIISPHNIIAGAATVGLASGREGEVMRTTVIVCAAYAAAGGAAAFLLLRSGVY